MLRILFIDRFPFSFNQDEASQGYAAYSLLQTGKDEWGTTWPVTGFKSFLDYKAPLYTYLTIPSVFVFGLNEFAVRLPSAIFGTLTILALYLLARRLFSDIKPFVICNLSFGIPEIAALFLTISPWSIQFSRSAMEANIFPALFLFGLLFFIEGKSKPSKLIVAAILWGLCFYSYHAAKIFLPPFVLIAYLLYRPKVSLKTVFIFVLIGAPVFYANIFGPAGRRGSELSVANLHPTEIISIANNQYYSPLFSINPILAKGLNNKLLTAADKFVSNYLSYFSIDYWFTNGSGDSSYANIPSRGLLYLWQLPFFIVGLLFLFKNTKTSSKILFVWGLLAALPAAITKDGYHPNRAVAFMALGEIIIACGFYYSFQLLKSKYQKPFLIIISTISLISFIFFANDYLFRYPINAQSAMSNGWPQAIKYILPIANQYQKIHLEPRFELQSYLAFYQPIIPSTFQLASKEWQLAVDRKKDILYLDQLGEIKLENYLIKDFSWPDDIDTDTLYVSKTTRPLPASRRTIYIVKSITQEPMVEIFDFRYENK